MSNLNKIFLMGRLTRDPELRYTPQGMPVADLGMAVNREYSLRSGERRKETLFIDATVWSKQAEICCQYLKKGSPLFVEGRLSMDSWEGQDGKKRVTYRVVVDNFQFLGSRRDGGGGEESSGPPGEFRRSGSAGGGGEYGSPGYSRGGPGGGVEEGEVDYSAGGRSAGRFDSEEAQPTSVPDEDLPF